MWTLVLYIGLGAALGQPATGGPTAIGGFASREACAAALEQIRHDLYFGPDADKDRMPRTWTVRGVCIAKQG